MAFNRSARLGVGGGTCANYKRRGQRLGPEVVWNGFCEILERFLACMRESAGQRHDLHLQALDSSGCGAGCLRSEARGFDPLARDASSAALPVREESLATDARPPS